MTPLTDIIAEVIGDAIADCAQIREGIGGPETAEVIRRYAEAAAEGQGPEILEGVGGPRLRGESRVLFFDAPRFRAGGPR